MYPYGNFVRNHPKTRRTQVLFNYMDLLISRFTDQNALSKYKPWFRILITWGWEVNFETLQRLTGSWWREGPRPRSGQDTGSRTLGLTSSSPLDQAHSQPGQCVWWIGQCSPFEASSFDGWCSAGLCLDYQSVQFSCSVMSNSFRPHRLQHARLPSPSPTPGAYSNSCPLNRWCCPTISSSVVPFSLSNFPSIRVFSNESLHHIRWPKYWSFSFSISP